MGTIRIQDASRQDDIIFVVQHHRPRVRELQHNLAGEHIDFEPLLFYADQESAESILQRGSDDVFQEAGHECGTE